MTAIREALNALEPFAEFAKDNVAEYGWNDVGLGTSQERIVDWFWPSCFRRAAKAYASLSSEAGDVVTVRPSLILAAVGELSWYAGELDLMPDRIARLIEDLKAALTQDTETQK